MTNLFDDNFDSVWFSIIKFRSKMTILNVTSLLNTIQRTSYIWKPLLQQNYRLLQLHAWFQIFFYTQSIIYTIKIQQSSYTKWYNCIDPHKTSYNFNLLLYILFFLIFQQTISFLKKLFNPKKRKTKGFSYIPSTSRIFCKKRKSYCRNSILSWFLL